MIYSYGLMAILALTLLFTPMLLFGQETPFLEDFGSGKPITSDWSLYEYGTGSINAINGCAFINITNRSKAGEYSIGAMQSKEKWKYVGLEIRLRCCDDNEMNGEFGGGSAWGFRDSGMKSCTDSILFVSHSPEHDEKGFFARCGIGGVFVFQEQLTGVDIREWHNYTIVWEPNNGTFLIDGEVVAATDKVPSYSMIAHASIHNMATKGGTRNTVDLSYNENIQVDYVRVFGVPEPTVLSILGIFLLVTPILSKRR
jgi:hypothetical protein